MSTCGYRQIYLPDYYCATKLGYVAEHRFIAEQKLGRHLKPGEVICHIDRDLLNNEPDNLLVFRTRTDMERYNKGGTLELTEDGSYISNRLQRKKACEYCGRIFIQNNAKQRFCSQGCACAANRKITNRPNKKQLKQLLLEFNISQIARIYSVNRNMVIGWCNLYKLPHKVKDLLRLRHNHEKQLQEKQLIQEQKAAIEESRLAQKQIDS